MARDEMFALRMSSEEKAEISQRAESAGMSIASYMIRCSLGTLDESSVEKRVDELEDRVRSLERLAELSM